MFQWLRRWREAKRLAQRRLFRFWDGQQWRYVDPYATYRKLVYHPTINLEAIGPLAEAGREPEATQLIQVISEGFGIPRWDPDTRRGMTDQELLTVLYQFWDAIEALKKNGSPGPTSWPPTDSESPPAQGSPSSTTKPSSDCGSIGPAPTSDGPGGPSGPSASASI